MNELTITVNIADRPYRLKITSEEEESVRLAAKRINEQIRKYSDNYAFNDRQDLLAMTALHFSTLALKRDSQQQAELDGLRSSLEKIDEMLKAEQ